MKPPRTVHLLDRVVVQSFRCQFHQHFMNAFCADILAAKNYAERNLRKSAQFAFVQKLVLKMLMKLTTGELP